MLNDDYVKFIRFGQWRIEQTGYGILALYRYPTDLSIMVVAVLSMLGILNMKVAK
jgi:hypothetical protein